MVWYSTEYLLGTYLSMEKSTSSTVWSSSTVAIFATVPTRYLVVSTSINISVMHPAVSPALLCCAVLCPELSPSLVPS